MSSDPASPIQVSFTPEFTVYSKTEQADIAPAKIRQIILDLEAPPDAPPEQQGNTTT